MTPLEFVYTSLLKPAPLRKLANAAIRAILPRTLQRHGATIVLNPNDPVVSGALTFGAYELPETRFFLSVCRPGLTFLDIGANVGYYTALALARMRGEGRIVALEPDPENFRYLRKTIAANQGAIATAVQKAASDHAGTMTLHTSADNRGDNRLYANELSSGLCEVRVERVDDILAGMALSEVNLIKMDVQGYEAHVLAGMRDTIANSRELILLSEFWPDGLRQAGSDPSMYLSGLRELGLNLYELTSGARLIPVTDPGDLIRRFPGRRYTNVVGFKGISPDRLPA
ncbi:MAG TPA: FkbM family methyltransferase [Bryobacteraceae bacterium]|nr:FkbM family methyltransferase [Bryobacteraceae bacterium]